MYLNIETDVTLRDGDFPINLNMIIYKQYHMRKETLRHTLIHVDGHNDMEDEGLSNT